MREEEGQKGKTKCMEKTTVGDLVEFCGIVVVQDDMETEEIFDNEERMFVEDGRESDNSNDKDGDSLRL
ncbi:hypothetical protein Csa_016298 [Cucumis sativus]|uniref:Uncharacterized protein n=1 Tax=Cucumis sativus TaxID=3659 RepID=A0A0A0K4L9_CUCSA|nr:hypothetical protein Csa_016298 [Cucumis sativus]